MISPPFLSPKSLKSKASCSNSKKKHEYCTISLFHIKGKKIEFDFLRGVFACLFFVFDIIKYLLIHSQIFNFPPEGPEVKTQLQQSLQQIHLKLIFLVTALFAHQAIDIQRGCLREGRFILFFPETEVDFFTSAGSGRAPPVIGSLFGGWKKFGAGIT